MSNNDEQDEETGLLSQKSELFRSRLLTNFHLLESIDSEGMLKENPQLNITDITDERRMERTMLRNPNGLVRFEVYEKRRSPLTPREKRILRLVNRRKQRKFFIDIWASEVIESRWYDRLVVGFIITNAVCLGIEAELDPGYRDRPIGHVLEYISYIAVIFFSLTISLRLMAGVRDFLQNTWNVLDLFFFVTSLVPEVVVFLSKYSTRHKSSPSFMSVMTDLEAFRIVRCLMIVSHLQKIRVMVLAMTKAFREIISITILLLVFAYIFAVTSITFLEQPDNVKVFSSFSTSLITLFQLFTLDHWLEIYREVTRDAGQLYAVIFVIVWVLIGSFIFKNVVVGIMVTSFQNIRQELMVKEVARREKSDKEMLQFAEELDRQNEKRAKERMRARRMSAMLISDNNPPEERFTSTSAKISDEDQSSVTEVQRCCSRHESATKLKEIIDEYLSKCVQNREEWQNIVEHYVLNLAKERVMFCWPQDSLFRYYLMLEALQENLTERQQLLYLAGECLALIHDR